jgi:hypothetical protein
LRNQARLEQRLARSWLFLHGIFVIALMVLKVFIVLIIVIVKIVTSLLCFLVCFSPVDVLASGPTSDNVPCVNFLHAIILFLFF